jgi:hypothetical protein
MTYGRRDLAHRNPVNSTQNSFFSNFDLKYFFVKNQGFGTQNSYI